jgi:hypothetical protein
MPWGADGNLRQVAVNPASGKLGASGGVCFLSSPLHDHRKRPSTATCGNLPHAARGILRQVAASCREWISSKKFSRAESSSEAETSSGAGSLLFPAHGKLPQVAVNLRFRRRQVAASCRKLPWRASCRKLRQVAASCRQVAVEHLAASCRKLPPSCRQNGDGKSRQLAATCRQPHLNRPARQLAATCRQVEIAT